MKLLEFFTYTADGFEQDKTCDICQRCYGSGPLGIRDQDTFTKEISRFEDCDFFLPEKKLFHGYFDLALMNYKK